MKLGLLESYCICIELVTQYMIDFFNNIDFKKITSN